MEAKGELGDACCRHAQCVWRSALRAPRKGVAGPRAAAPRGSHGLAELRSRWPRAPHSRTHLQLYCKDLHQFEVACNSGQPVALGNVGGKLAKELGQAA
eukprot:scaffold218018_cov31-Tisochrysis_lutea.AAC.2